MEVNFLGTFAVTQAFAPVLGKNGGGAIANLNSVASFVSFPILTAYSASKAATHSLTQVTRAMLRRHNRQRQNCVNFPKAVVQEFSFRETRDTNVLVER